MKIEKLKAHNGRYELAELPEKINEIIDFLNNSFITNDPDTIYTDLTSIACDRLEPLSNEIQQLSVYDSIESKGLFSDIKCPKCGAKHFEVGNTSCTTVYYPMIIKDGVNINPDRNICSTTYICRECGHIWKE